MLLNQNKKINTHEKSLDFDGYLAFLNSLNKNFHFKTILKINSSECIEMPGWEAVISLTCLNNHDELYDLDIRYAWGTEIFKQNLFDHGWSEKTLLHRQFGLKTKRHKLIVYLCHVSTGLKIARKYTPVPKRFIIGSYWQTVSHLYLLLPLAHPFKIPPITEERAKISYATTHDLCQQYSQSNESNNEVISVPFLPPSPKRLGEGGLRTKGLFKARKNDPFLSVITVVFNGSQYIEQTIQSVINQSYQNIEYIIVDGGSTDGTIEIIRRYEDQINYWVSETDNGLYDAMNKGTLLACGSHTLHTNADDLLFQPNALKAISKNTNLLKSVLIYHVKDNFIIQSYPQKPNDNLYLNILHVPVHHPAFIGLKTIHSTFDCTYRIIADAIVIATKVKNEKFEIFSDILAIYRRCGGVSDENNFSILKENWQVILPSRDIKAIATLFFKEIKCRIREFAKLIGLIKLKRIYRSYNTGN